MDDTVMTRTHEFRIWNNGKGFAVSYRLLNPKTGKPWQANRPITDLATVEGRFYSSRPAARLAVMRAKAKFLRLTK